MPFLPVSIPPGVVRGATPNDSRGRWYDTNLVRWKGGVLEPVGGWERIVSTPFATRIRKMEVWRSNAQARFIVAASVSKVYSEYGQGFVDITPAGLLYTSPGLSFYGFGVNEYGEEGYGTPRSTPSTNLQVMAPYWSFSNWGEDLLAVSSVDGKLYHYDVTTPATPMTAVASAPTGNSSVIVTPERHAMLLQVGGNPRRIGWSSREDFTDWNFASVANTAGFLDLETRTPLLKAAPSRSGTLVFSSSDVFLMSYIGLPYIYGQSPLGKSRLVAADSIVTDNGNVFWWASDGFKMFDGGAIRTMECPVWDYVMSRVNLNAVRLFAHGGNIGFNPEIWWFYPSGDSTQCDSYVMVNYVEGWWAIGSLARSAMVGADADRFPYMAGEDNFLYQHESGWSGAVEGIRNVYAESAALALGAGDNSMEIKQALPSGGHGYDSIQARFFTRLTPEGAERSFGPYLTRADGYMDTRVSGRDVRLRLENIKNADWSIGELRLDVSQGGRR